jgi:uncharacterized protein YkwD
MLALALLLPGLAAPADAAADDPRAAASSGEPFRDAVLRELNRVRARHALPPVRVDRSLGGAAGAHSRDMARRRYFAHGRWTTRVKAASGRASDVGEVIGWITAADAASEASWMVKSWLDSPPHRAVLLSRGFHRVGIGRATRAHGGATASLYTADFASSR